MSSKGFNFSVPIADTMACAMLLCYTYAQFYLVTSIVGIIVVMAIGILQSSVYSKPVVVRSSILAIMLARIIFPGAQHLPITLLPIGAYLLIYFVPIGLTELEAALRASNQRIVGKMNETDDSRNGPELKADPKHRPIMVDTYEAVCSMVGVNAMDLGIAVSPEIQFLNYRVGVTRATGHTTLHVRGISVSTEQQDVLVLDNVGECTFGYIVLYNGKLIIGDERFGAFIDMCGGYNAQRILAKAMRLYVSETGKPHCVTLPQSLNTRGQWRFIVECLENYLTWSNPAVDCQRLMYQLEQEPEYAKQ